MGPVENLLGLGNWQHEWNTLIRQNDSRYLHDLAEFYQNIRALQPQMEKVPTYSEFMAKDTGYSPRNEPLQILSSVLGLAYNVNLKTIVDKLRRR